MCCAAPVRTLPGFSLRRKHAGWRLERIAVAGWSCSLTNCKSNSIITRLSRLPAFFDGAAAFLGIQPSFLRAGRRLGRSPGRGPFAGFIDQLDQPLDRVAAVRLLRSAPARMEHQEAIVADAFTRQSNQPVADVGRQ